MIAIKTELVGRIEIPSNLTDRARTIAHRTLRQWADDRRGLGVRFTPEAYGLYGYAHRSPDYEAKHPAPYVKKGGLRDAITGGGASVTSEATPDGFSAELSASIPGRLAGATAGLYGLQWAVLNRPEATVLDDRMQAGLRELDREVSNG